ncbi:MAG: dephospho-CoA kinase [Frankia sp.]
MSVRGIELALDQGAVLARLGDLMRAAQPRAGRTRIIGVDGRSGAGKTTLARRLSAYLPAPVVSLEDLYGGWDGLTAGVDRLVSHVLTPLAETGHALVPQFDWTTSAWLTPSPLLAQEMLVVEGVGCGARAAARFMSVLVWIEEPEDRRRSRALARDGDTYAPHWDRWAAQEADLLARERTWSRADVVLRSQPPDLARLGVCLAE